MKALLKSLIPAAVMAAVFSCVYLLPQHDKLLESSISPNLPTGFKLMGWYGVKTQESEVERSTLAADTKFSKANYREDTSSWGTRRPEINVSIVYSGSDMNNSIHRPERCLPAQGHQDLRASVRTVKLANGREITFTRLTSYIPNKEVPGGVLRFTHYYTFIGHGTMCHGHLQRTARDMYDRVVKGSVERWAYIQVGTYWGDALGLSETEADTRILNLISDLLPKQINWGEIDN